MRFSTITRWLAQYPTYYRVLKLMIVVGFVLTIWWNPYGSDFQKITVPIILIFASTQSLLLPHRWYNQLLSSLLFIMAGGVLLEVVARRMRIEGYLALSVMLMATYTFLICRFVTSGALRSLSAAQSLWVTFILVIGHYLQYHGVRTQGLESGRLFSGPLLAMGLWSAGSLYGWSQTIRITFLVALFQIVIGLFDVAMREHLRALEVCSGVLLLIGLVFLMRWPEKLFPLPEALQKKERLRNEVQTERLWESDGPP